jgi:hypothetical protein
LQIHQHHQLRDRRRLRHLLDRQMFQLYLMKFQFHPIHHYFLMRQYLPHLRHRHQIHQCLGLNPIHHYFLEKAKLMVYFLNHLLRCLVLHHHQIHHLPQRQILHNLFRRLLMLQN